MQDQLKSLYELQSLDDSITALNREAERIPAKIEEINHLIQEQSALVEQKESGLKLLAKKHKDKEGELEILETKIKNDKIKLTDVKTNKEYHALQKEISTFQNQMGVVEEEILLLMDDTEQYDVECKRVLSRFQIAKKELEGKISEFESRLADIPSVLEEKKGERLKLAGKVNEDLLSRYEATKRQREGNAVAFVENGICMGCNIGLQPQLFNLVQRNEQVYTCPNCYRILYFPGTPTINHRKEDVE